jgi:hypothetical protein
VQICSRTSPQQEEPSQIKNLTQKHGPLQQEIRRKKSLFSLRIHQDFAAYHVAIDSKIVVVIRTQRSAGIFALDDEDIQSRDGM